MRVEGNYLKYLNSGCNRKEQRRNKDFKIGGQAGPRGGCLNRGGGWNPLTNYVYVFMHIVCTYVCIRVSYLYHIYIYICILVIIVDISGIRVLNTLIR